MLPAVDRRRSCNVRRTTQTDERTADMAKCVDVRRSGYLYGRSICVCVRDATMMGSAGAFAGTISCGEQSTALLTLLIYRCGRRR